METLQKDFNKAVKQEITIIKQMYEIYKKDRNPKVKEGYVKKYPFLKRNSKLPFVYEILQWPQIKERFSWEDHIRPLLQNNLIPKLTGIYKHGQTEKTGLCNKRIIQNMKLGKFTIAVTKNTLDAKNQWEERFIKMAKEEFPNTQTKEQVLLLSSKKNDLKGNAVHCKNISEVIAKILTGKFKVLFMCSNNKRFEDILTLLDAYSEMSAEKQLPVEIQDDEAHNREEGIPSKREYVEHIILHPNVETFVPVTASYDTICDEKNLLWIKSNLDYYAINYTHHSNTLSTSEDYSSISDANQLSFETMMRHPKFKQYGITEFDEETFNEADNFDYSKWPKEDIEGDKLRRRQLEFCMFMKLERDACNLGMNYLDNYMKFSYNLDDSVIITPIILSDISNFHIITTPHRVALTLFLMKYALQKDYKPICIGLYRSQIHIRYNNKHGQIINKKYSELSESATGEELNNKLNNVLIDLVEKGESINRPVLIFGNYKPTGESITFVNYKYGTIRSVVSLPNSAQSREMDYQNLLRCCYMDTKFKEHDEHFVHPLKWIVAYQANINNALSYEKQNDARINEMKSGNTSNALIPLINPQRNQVVSTDYISVPIRYIIEDVDNQSYKELNKILSKGTRSEIDKGQMLNLMNKLIIDSSASCIDPTGKFNFMTYKVKDVRSWKTHSEEEIKMRALEGKKPFEADYRFKEYDSAHKLKNPYINNKSNINVNECEILVAHDKYVYESFTNNKTCIWISYKYANA
jgi:hypothetical protein